MASQPRNSLILFLVVLGLLCPASLCQKQTTTQLTSPTSAAVHVPSTVPLVSLTKPSGPPTVLNTVSQYDYEAHMNFQRSEDALGAKLDLIGSQVTEKLDTLKQKVEDDHKDVESLKETRSSWQAYLVVGGGIWVIITTLTGWLNKDRLVNLVRRTLGPETKTG